MAAADHPTTLPNMSATPHTPILAIPIAAIATAPGRGGIDVVRVSEPNVHAVMHAVYGRLLTPRQATYLPFLDVDNNTIDRGIALWFPTPHSHTGEDMLRLQGHDGPIVMQLLLQCYLTAGREIGLRVTEPGELARHAFLNGRMGLAQAEVVADLIEASTEAAARSMARPLDDAFSRAVHTLVERVIHLRMLVEATLNFPEEEIDFLEASDARGQFANIRTVVDGVLAQVRQGALLHGDLHVVLAGQPNVGKSSLLNTLIGAELAIVTPIAGTTRDKVRQTIQVEDIPLSIVNTAGLRDAEGEVKCIGIERTWTTIARADVMLYLLDATDYRAKGPSPEDTVIGARIVEHMPAGVPTLRVINKIDLSGVAIPCHVDTELPKVWPSARDGLGVELLHAALLEIADWQGGDEGLYLTRERHLAALRTAREHLATAAEHVAQQAQSLDLFAEELRLAQGTLNSIMGAFSSDDSLGVIFSRFCIGR